MIAQIIVAVLATWVSLLRQIIIGIVQLIACAASSIQADNQARHLSQIAAEQAAAEQADAPAALEVASLQNRITAELTMADAARSKATHEKDPYKRAQWLKREQDANARADRMQDRINRLQRTS